MCSTHFGSVGDSGVSLLGFDMIDSSDSGHVLGCYKNTHLILYNKCISNIIYFLN